MVSGGGGGKVVSGGGGVMGVRWLVGVKLISLGL